MKKPCLSRRDYSRQCVFLEVIPSLFSLLESYPEVCYDIHRKERKENASVGRYPYVIQNKLYPALGEEPLELGSADWLAWVSEHTAFTYRDQSSRYAVRREQRPGGLYWYAYKRVDGR